MTPAPSRPRLLFVATGIERTTGGIASANRNVLAALDGMASARGGRAEALVLGEPVRREAGYRAFGGAKAGFALATLAAMPGADLIVFDHVRLALPMLAVPPALRPPVVICAHGSESWRRMKPGSIPAFRAADLVLANSAYTLGRMQARFSGFAGVACPLGLPPQFAMTAAPPAQGTEPIELRAADGVVRGLGPRMLLLVGRLDPGEREKGHRELMAVMPALAERFPEVQLVFVGGGGDLTPLTEAARASSAAAGIFLPGQVATEQLAALYRRAYAYVMPSRQEGFGLVYLEAMNFAKPCLACRDDGGAEVVVDGETGLLVDQPIDLGQLRDRLGDLLADPARARAMGEAGWRRLAAQFSSQAHQARVAGLVAPLLDARARSRPGERVRPLAS